MGLFPEYDDCLDLTAEADSSSASVGVYDHDHRWAIRVVFETTEDMLAFLDTLTRVVRSAVDESGAGPVWEQHVVGSEEDAGSGRR